MIIHLLKNNPLMGRLVSLFEDVNHGNNLYFVHGKLGALNSKNEEKFTTPNFIYFDEASQDLLDRFNTECKESDLLMIQAGTSINQVILNQLKEDIPKHLFFWGFETYLHHYFFYKQIFKGTRKFSHPETSWFKASFMDFKRYIKEWLNDRTRFQYLDKIDSFSAGFVEEASWMKKHINLNKPFLPFTFYSHVLENHKHTYNPVSTKILLGNSATNTMNHVDAIPILKKTYFDKLIIPLSYGNANYRDFVMARFSSEFEDSKLHFLIDFMDLKEYELLMGTCGIVWINAYCQQAVGNCINALSKGCALFFPEKSFLYKGFTTLGYKVYSADELPGFSLQKHIESAMIKNFTVFKSDRSPETQRRQVFDIMKFHNANS